MVSKFRKTTGDYSFFRNLFNHSIYVASCEYHLGNGSDILPGKIGIVPTRSLIDQHELSMAYSPGVAAPCLKIFDNQEEIYDYTSKGNMVAVVTDGSAVLGLGDIGADASLPVMEGKSVLFKKFAGIDSIPIVVDERDPDMIVKIVSSISGGWGGINLEDISGPRCFEIEKKLQEAVDIPVMHDDQHGTAIVAGAGLINACDITKRKIEDVKMVVCGAGAAGIACLKFFISLGVKKENVILCDRHGVVYKDRPEEMDNIRLEFAREDDKLKTLGDAMVGADVFVGLSSAKIVTPEMLSTMAKDPIVFAMANPEPEISVPLAKEIRSDIIMATGRSDYPNQVNNVMGFPYIFRGALDVRARKINDEMKLAAAYAIADLARKPVHDDVFTAYPGRTFEYGPEYIIPAPFDPRLITIVAPAVAKAAMDSGVARIVIKDLEKYRSTLSAKLDPTLNLFQLLHEKVKSKPKRVVFAEGEEEKIIRVATQYVDGLYGEAILVGDEETVKQTAERIGIKLSPKIKIMNSALCDETKLNKYIEYFYKKNQRLGKLERDCVRDVKTDRNVFASCILACGDADAMITGLTRSYYEALSSIKISIDHDELMFGISAIITHGKIVFMTDTAINSSPSAKQLSEIAMKSAKIIRAVGQTPRVALLSYATFGNPNDGERATIIRDAIKILHSNPDLNFECDGEMTAEVALNEDLLKKYPFVRLTKEANVLVVPGLHTADISQKLIKSLTNAVLVGPILIGFKNPVQIISMSSSVSEILNMAILSASGVLWENK
jgi:malate dehydrogenase (oxaloacetate-decarboxylating)(NADP+)